MPTENPYLSLVQQQVQGDETGLRETLHSVKDANPDLTARAMPLAEKLKLPVNVVEQDVDGYEKQAAFQDNDYNRIVRDYPSLSDFLKNTENAKLAHDDVGVLTSTADFFRSLGGGVVGDTGGTALRGGGALLGAGTRLVDKAYQDPAMILMAPGGFIFNRLLATAAPGIEQGGAAVQDFSRETISPPQERQGLHTDIGSGLGQVAAQIGVFLTTGGVGNAAMMAAQGAGQQAERADEAGATQGQKDTAVALGAAVTAVTESVQLGVLMKGVPGMDKLLGKLPQQLQNKWLNRIVDIGGAGGAEATQEVIEGFLQDSVEYLVYNNEVEFLKEWDREAIAAGSTGAIVRGIVKAATGRRGPDVRSGEESQQVAEALNETAKQSKLRARSPEKYRQAIDGIGEGSVYVNVEGAQTFYQSLTPEDQARLNAAMPDLQQKIEAAAETGSDVAIDRRDYMAYIAGTDQAEVLKEFTKLSEADLSMWDQQQLAEQVNQVADDGSADQETQGLDEVEQLERRIYDILLATEERGNADNARTQAQLVNLRALLAQAKGDPAQQERLLKIFDSLTIQRQGKVSGRDATDEWLNEARKSVEKRRKAAAKPAEKDLLGGKKQKKGKAAPTPIISWLGGMGGIDGDNPIAGELRAMDITPKSHSRLFKRGSALRFDALPASEFNQHFADRQIVAKEDGNGYVDTDWLLEQIRDESFGKGALTPEQRAEDDRQRQIDELESMLAEAGLDIETATNAEIRKLMEGAGGEEGQRFFQSAGQQDSLRSALVDAASALKQEKGSGEQFLSALKNTAGVKEEEIAWTGLDEFLKGKKSVTKAEVLEYLEANAVSIEEVTLGSARQDSAERRRIAEIDAELQRTDLTEEDRDALENEKDLLLDSASDLEAMGHRGETKFAQYTLPGGENYREVLLTLPAPSAFDPEKVALRRYNEGAYSYVEISYDGEVQGNWDDKGQDDNHWRDLMGRRFKGDALTGVKPKHGGFVSSHFEQPNILAHVRLNDRTDADGKRVLFVEEIQSDWHQAGRKKGYKGQATDTSGWSAKKLQTEWEIEDAEGVVRAVVARADAGTEAEAISQAAKKIEGGITDNRVPDAPFKKTWHEMAFRRVVQMAANQGYDRVAWTTGDVQADRYDLSKQISSIGYKKRGENLFNMTVWDKSDNQVYNNQSVAAADLEDIVGKEMAQKIIEGQGRKDGEFTYLEDLDLKVGGEGMKGFYDKILPAYAKKFVKKFGGSVGTTTIEAPETAGQNDTLQYEVYDPSGQVYDAFPTLEGAEQAAQDNGPGFTVKSPDRLRGLDTWSIDITPEMRETANPAFTLFQPNRGQFQALPDGKTVITAFQGQDLSTVIHELGHFYSYLLRDMATQFPDSAWSEQWATVSGWWQSQAKSILKEARTGQHYKIEKEEASGRFIVRGPYGKQFGLFATRREAQSERDSLQTNLTVELTGLVEADVQRVIQEGAKNEAESILHIVMEEQFARGFEVYLMEGKAPSVELKQAFRRFKAWLLGIYRDVRNLGVNLSPEIRGVFDRLLATEEQIEAMRQLEAFQPDPAVIEGLTKAERERYIRQSEEAVEYAKERLARDLLKDERKKQTAEYKAARDKLLAENLTMLRESAPYRAQDAMQAEGADPAVIADLYGYTSANEMQQALAGLEPIERKAARITDTEMRARYGDMLNDGTIERAAVERLNEAEAGFVKSQMELKEAAEKAGKPVTSADALKALAQKMHDDMTVRDATQATRHMRAAVKAARLYGAAAKAGKWEDAAKFKRQQILSQRLYTLSREADKYIEKNFNKWGRLLKKSNKDAAQVIDIEYLNAIRAILGKFGVTRGKGFDVDRWLTGILAVDPDLYDQLSAVIDANAKNARPYKDLSMNEFYDLVAAVDNLIGVEKRRKEVEVLGKKVQLEEAVDQIVESIETNLKPLPQGQDARSKWKFKAAQGFGRYLGLLKKMETYVQAMDGGNVMGTVHRYLRSEIIQAEAVFVKRSGESAKAFQELVEKHYTEGKGLESLADRKDAIFIPEIGDSYTRLEIITVALNTGNEGNLDRVLSGRNWKEDQLEGVLRHMREKDWQFVQDTWDMINSRWPEIAQNHRERYGFVPGKVDAVAAVRVTAEGKSIDVKGGYFPIAYDSELSVAAAQAEQQQTLKDFGPVRYAKAQTRQGHKKERVEGQVKNRPIQLNGLYVIQRHLDQVNYDLAMGKQIEDVNKIIRHPRFQKAVTDYMGTGAFQDIDLWLKDTAVGPLYSDTSWIGRKARWLRTAYTGTRLGLRVSTFLVQFTGLTNSVVAVGANNMRHGAVEFTKLSARDPFGAFKAVREKSVFMETNFTTLNRDVADTIARLEGKGWVGKVNKGFMLPMMASQYTVNVVTWLGAYHRAFNVEGMPEAEAIRYADLAVERSQGSGMMSTLSALERGTVGPQTRLSEGWKLWTTLRSYFYTKMNLAIQRTNQTIKNPTPREVTKLAADYVMLFWVEALIAELLLGRLPDLGDDEEPEKEAAMYLADIGLNTVAAGLPGVDIAYGATKGFDAAPAPARVLDDVATFSKNTVDLFTGDDEEINWYAYSRSLVTAGAYGLKGATGLTLPAAQMNDYIRGLEKAANGEDPSVLDYLRYKRD